MVASGDRVSPPIEFEPNVGQAPRDVSFQSHSHGCQIKLLKTAATDIACGDVRLSMLFQGSLPSVPVAEGLLPGTSNYFSGANPKEWRTNIPNYSRVRYPDLYQHIDVVYRANRDWLEYDLEVEPGGDPGRIQIRFPGSRRVSVDQAGNLIVATAAGTMRLPPPHI